MTKKKKACIIIASICLFLILLAMVLSQFTAVNMNDFVFTVVFDKHEVMNADKIVLREGDRSVTITDPDLIREIASEFVVSPFDYGQINLKDETVQTLKYIMEDA